jgi:23S rRNA pseudouridine1911/1915/1917 synthase
MEDIQRETLIEDEDRLYDELHITVDRGQSPLRIDVFLLDKLPHASRNKIQQSAKAGCISVNEKVVKSNYKVRPLDKIQLILPQHKNDYSVVAENIDLDIVYDDDDVMLVNKPAGMVVHPGHGNYCGTLVNGLAYLYETLPQINGNTRPGVVHRIDKNTTGLLVVGKTDYALNHLAKQFFERTIERHYLGLVWGNVEQDFGRIEVNIARSTNDRKVFVAIPEGNVGKYAVTHYEVVKRYGYVTLLKFKLETGRTHQIRVHMKYIGHTLFNDFTYQGDKIHSGTVHQKYKQFIQNAFEIMPHHALHAQSLGFIHPTSGVKMYFESPLPDNFQLLLQKWENYSRGFNI